MSKQAQERSRAGAYRVRALAGALALALAGVGAMSAAFAGPNDGPGRRDDRGQQAPRRDFRDSRWGDAADPRSFEARAEEQRRIMQENANNAEMSRRMSRMTPDERRDLRRQINEASQEVYSVTPRR
jgi:hypothetical protein